MRVKFVLYKQWLSLHAIRSHTLNERMETVGQDTGGGDGDGESPTLQYASQLQHGHRNQRHSDYGYG